MNFNFTPADDSKDPLKEYGRNLNDEAALNKLDPIIGRDDEIRRVIRILSRKTKNNPILVGEPGVGKTAIAEGLAHKIVTGDVPENLKNKEIYELDIASLIAGAQYQGQFEKRIKSVMKKIKESNGDIILFIDEIHTLIGTGKNSQGGLDAAQILKPMLARGEMKLIGATTIDEHRKYIESDPAFERRMQIVKINEPSPEDALTILRGIKEKFENYHKVKITDEALQQAVSLSTRYISDRFLPDKAIDLIDEAAAGIQTQINSKPVELEKLEHKLAVAEMEKHAIEKEDKKDLLRIAELDSNIKLIQADVNNMKSIWESEKEATENISALKELIELLKIKQQRYQAEGEFAKASELLYQRIPAKEQKLKELMEIDGNKQLIKEIVTAEEIADVVSKWTGIPVAKLAENEREKLLRLHTELSKRVKGQDEALNTITDVVLRSRADINDPNRPIGSFIFMGPTGVGKTEVAKALASELFDSEKALTRIDMSEYMEIHSVSRLIGSPPGYVGHDAGGQLTEQIRTKPYSIVLFDEIEKAHPKVLDVLLQIMDEGHITDGKGKLVNFKNTIIIMTTNIGSIDILEGKSSEDVEKELNKYLRPEFINRIDEVVTFNSLSKVAIKLIAQNELKKLEEKLASKEIFINFTETAIDKVATDPYDVNYGARPIKRYIQKQIESDLARKIISEEIVKNKPFECIVEDGKFTYINKTYN